MSVVTYNGVTFNYVTTRSFQQQMVRDESGLDYLYIKFTISVDCVWNPEVFPCPRQPDGNPLNDQLPPAYVALRGTQPAEAMAGPLYPSREGGLRALLNQDRKAFSYADDDGHVLVSAPAAAGGSATDDALGPLVRDLSITKLSGSNTYHVGFTVEVGLAECAGAPGNPSPPRHKAILSNRWSQTMGVDAHGMQNRTHAGKLVISGGSREDGSPTNYLTNPPCADDYRGWVLPPIPAGFARDSMTFSLSKTGLELGYSATDKQQPRVLDRDGPAIRFSLEFWEESGNFGGTADAGISVRLTGGPYEDPRDLVALGFQMVLARVGVNTDPNTGLPNADSTSKAFRGVLAGSRLSERISNDGPAEISLRVNLKKVFAPADAIAREPKFRSLHTLPLGVDGSLVGVSPPLVTPPAAGQPARPRIPGTFSPLTEAGAGPADFGTYGEPGVKLFAQALASPCAPVGGPGAARWVKAADTPVFKVDQNAPAEATPRSPAPAGAPAAGARAVLGDSDSRPERGTVSESLRASYLVMQDAITKVTMSLVASLPSLYEADGLQTAWSLSNYAHLYTDYTMDVQYETDYHAIQMPVASNVPVPCRVINLAAPTCTKTVRWTCERVGAPPELPSQDTRDANDVILSARLTGQSVSVAPDGVSYVYLRSGEYAYALRVAPTEAGPLYFGSTPNLRTSTAENMLPGGRATYGPALVASALPPRVDPVGLLPPRTGPVAQGPPVVGDNR